MVDPLAARQDLVYMTPQRWYARYHASLWGRGDLYRVEAVGSATRSTEDTVPSVCAAAALVIAVIDRAVLLTDKERRTNQRLWKFWDERVDAMEAVKS